MDKVHHIRLDTKQFTCDIHNPDKMNSILQ